MKKYKFVSIIIMYSLSLFLFIWYCIILIDSLNPKVSLEYKMHYIEKTLIDWPGDNGLNYKLGSKLMFGTEYNNMAKCRGNGWYQAEKKANWTSEKCEIYLNITNDAINDDKEMELVLQAAVPKSEVSVNINGKNISTFKPNENRDTYVFSIPKEILEEKFLCIEFNIEDTKTASELNQLIDEEYANYYKNDDKLGIYVESIKLG